RQLAAAPEGRARDPQPGERLARPGRGGEHDRREPPPPRGARAQAAPLALPRRAEGGLPAAGLLKAAPGQLRGHLPDGRWSVDRAGAGSGNGTVPPGAGLRLAVGEGRFARRPQPVSTRKEPPWTTPTPSTSSR